MASKVPACVRSMGCLCCGHARGAPASMLCNASEDAPVYRRPARLPRMTVVRDGHGRIVKVTP